MVKKEHNYVSFLAQPIGTVPPPPPPPPPPPSQTTTTSDRPPVGARTEKRVSYIYFVS